MNRFSLSYFGYLYDSVLYINTCCTITIQLTHALGIHIKKVGYISESETSMMLLMMNPWILPLNTFVTMRAQQSDLIHKAIASMTKVCL